MMHSSKPQDWMREYAGGRVMHTETDHQGRWRETGSGIPNRGPDGERDQLWVCPSRSCRHAEPADD